MSQTQPPHQGTPPESAKMFQNSGRQAPATIADVSDAYIAQLAVEDPLKAQALMNLRKQFAEVKKEETERVNHLKFQKRNLAATVEKDREDIARRQACAQAGHVREDGSSALSGQYLNGDKSQLLTVCNQCQATYTGVGNKEGQLPSYLATKLDASILGG